MSMHFYNSNNKGFTLVELLVAIAIFTVMTSILVVKYGGFSEGMTLTNLAYDIALTLREAQSYGINSSDAGSLTGAPGKFDTAYGAYFNVGNRTRFTLYGDYDAADTGGKVGYTGSNENIRVMTMKQGNRLDYLCVRLGTGSCATNINIIDIQFKRPDPSPIIYAGTNANSLTKNWDYAEVRVVSPNKSYRKVVVRTSGQISVEETGVAQSR